MGILTLGLIAGYGTGVYVASKKADRVYSGPQKWLLVGFWPVAFATNRRFRENFRR